MRRILLLVLLLGAAALAEKEIGTFRLKQDPLAPMRAWVLEATEEGLRVEYLGGGKRALVPWSDLVDEDATALRQKYGLELTEDEKLGLIPGHEVFFKGGTSVVGILIAHDEEAKRYLLRTGGLVLPYPDDRVDRIEETKVKETDVYDESEIYIRRLERRPPQTAKEHRDLANYLYDVGNFQKSYEHYEEAIRGDPSLRAGLEERLAEIKDLLEDAAAVETFRKAKWEANYNGRFDRAIAMIEDYIAQYPGSKRRGLRVEDEIREKRMEQLQRTYHRVKAEELNRSVRRYLVIRKPSLQEAMSWITSEAKDQVEAGTRERMGLSEEEYELVRQSKSAGAPHWATYWSGSFILDKRAKKGKSSQREVRGDPDSWWGTYDDVNTRATWLKAYAAERLPDLFEIVQIRMTPCEKCGGTGQVKHMSIRALADGRHEWMETCPRCFGAGEDRGVGYR